jgi:hypothetical protein
MAQGWDEPCRGMVFFLGGTISSQMYIDLESLSEIIISLMFIRPYL